MDVRFLRGLVGALALLPLFFGAARADSFLTVGADGIVKRWDSATLTTTAATTLATLSKEGVGAAAISPDGKWLALGGADKMVHLVALPGGKMRDPIAAHDAAVTSLGFSADSTTLISTGKDGAVTLWSVDAGKKGMSVAKAHEGGAVQGQTVAGMVITVGADGKLDLWDDAGSQQLSTATEHSGGVRGLILSTTEQRAFTFGVEGLVRSWSMDGPVDFADDKRTEIIGLAVSPDGKWLAAACADGSMKLYDTVKNEKTATIPDAHKGGVTAIAFLPDGKTIVTAGADKSLKMWATDGRLLASVAGAAEAKILAVLPIPAAKKPAD